MPGAVPCPEPQVLRQFALGRLPLVEVEKLAEHVESCARCVDFLHSLREPDALVEGLHGMPACGQEPPPELVEQLFALRVPDLPTLEKEPGGLLARLTEPVQAAMQELRPFLTPPRAPGEIGQLGHYRLRKVLGAGGMGVVFLAEDPHLKRSVALKTLRSALAANPAARRRFLREAQAAAAITHDHVISILHVGEEDGVPFLAMPFLPGETLESRLKREGKLPLPEVLRYGRQIAEGLATAHNLHLIHRDIKPSNIWLEALPDSARPTSSIFRVKILDFGLAQLVGENVPLGQAGYIVGTPAYMAPEQARGEATDARTDLFSLGCVLFQMATGELPFKGATAKASLRALELESPAPPQALDPQLPQAFCKLVLRLLDKDPGNRLSSAQDVVDAIAAIEASGSASGLRGSTDPSADNETTTIKPRRPSQLLVGHRRTLAASMLLVALVALGFLFGPFLQPIGERDEAEQIDPTALTPELLTKRDEWSLASRRPEIPNLQLAVAGGGDPRHAPPGLVAVLGDGRLSHWDEVNGLGFSSDGQLVASSSWDHTVMVWDRRTGGLVRTFSGHGAKVAALAVSVRDVVASGSFDGALILWDLATGKARHTLVKAGPQDTWQDHLLHGVAFTRDGLTLASASWDGTARLWSVATGKAMKTIEARQGWIHHVAFSPDGKRLATAGEDGTVKLWAVPTGRLLHTLARHKGPVVGVDFSSNGQLLASASLDFNAMVWDPATGTLVRTLAGHRAGVSSLAFSPDDKLLATGSNDSTLKLWNTRTWTATSVLRGRLPGSLSAVHGLAFSKDAKTLASGDHDGTIHMWDPSTGEELLVRSGHQSSVNGLALSPNGRFLASGSNDRSIRLWDLTTGKCVQTLTGHTGQVTSLDFSRDGRWLASGGADATLNLWQTDFLKARALFGHGRDVRCVTFAPDGSVLASASADHTIILWDPRTGKRLHTLKGHMDQVDAVAFSDDGQVLASAGADGLVKLWKTASGRELKSWRGQTGGLDALAFQGHGKLLAVAGKDGVRLWDAATGKEQRTLAEAPRKITCVTFSPDGRLLASAGSDGTVRVWDAATGASRQVIHVGPSHGTINRVLFSLDGRHLITANFNGTIYILRLAASP